MLIRSLLVVLGISTIVLALHEVFSDIFQPVHSGTLSDLIAKSSYKLFRGTRLGPSSGPMALILIILAWIVSLAFGFALIYCACFPHSFSSQTNELAMSFGPRLVHCFYFSLGALATFQTFDLSPDSSWLRLIVAAEGLIGISMITASVSWLVLLYPALERTRQFSLRLSVIEEAEKLTGISSVEELGVSTLLEVAKLITTLQLDLVLFPILLNFRALEKKAEIGSALPFALRLSRDGMDRRSRRDIRLAAAQLQAALDSLSTILAERVLNTPERDNTKVFDLLSTYG